MSEVTFERKRNLTDDEIVGLLEQRVGAAILLQNWPDDTQKVFKILAEPVVKEFEDADNPAVYWTVAWKHKDGEIGLLLRTSKAAYDSFMKKKEEEKFDYIGKYSIFAKGKSEKGSYHSVSKPMEKPLKEFKDPLMALKEMHDNPVKDNTDDLKQRASDFVSEFMKAVGKLNSIKKDDADKVVPSVELAASKYLMKYYKTEYNAIKDMF